MAPTSGTNKSIRGIAVASPSVYIKLSLHKKAIQDALTDSQDEKSAES